MVKEDRSVRYSEFSDWRLTTETFPLYKDSVTVPVTSLLCVLDKRVQRLAQGSEPQAEVNQFRIFQSDVLFEVRDIALQAQGFEFAMRGNQQSAAGSLVATARLDSDEAVLHQINPSDGISPADFVQQLDQRNRIELHAIHRNWNAFFKADDDLLLAVGSVLRRTSHLPGGGKRRVARIFQFPALVADVPEIAVAAVNFLPAGFDGNSPLLRVVETIFARLQIPLPPWRDDFQLRSQGLKVSSKRT